MHGVQEQPTKSRNTQADFTQPLENALESQVYFGAKKFFGNPKFVFSCHALSVTFSKAPYVHGFQMFYTRLSLTFTSRALFEMSVWTS